MKKLSIYFTFFYFIFNIEIQGKTPLVLIECDYKSFTQLSENSEKHKGMRKLVNEPLKKHKVKHLYYIDNDKSVLLKENKKPAGRTVLLFNDTKIVISTINKLDKTKLSLARRLYHLIDIDRRTGNIEFTQHVYDPTDVFHKDKILKMKYYGECKKIENTKKF